jgi:hypothetical protein
VGNIENFISIRRKAGKPIVTTYEAKENILRSKYKILEFHLADKAWLGLAINELTATEATDVQSNI